MLKSKLAAAFAASLVMMPLSASAETMVKDVDVSVDLDAIQNPRAATYWTSVDDDLENAIVARLTGQLAGEDDEGSSISVDLDEVELASTFDSAMGIADSKLAGEVHVTSDNDNTKFDQYEIVVTFDQAVIFLPEGTDIAVLTTDSAKYYHAMIDAFADSVVLKLK